ncbi:MAG: TPR end-of-group domain-containing protein, partial [Blastocatellia bacterium]
GRKPFEGPATSNVIAAILESEPPPLRQIAGEAAAELEQVVMRALRKDREERYQTARVMLADLERLKIELEVKNGKVRSPAFRRKGVAAESFRLKAGLRTFSVRRKRAVAAAALAVLALAIIAFLARDRLWPASDVAAEPITLAVLPFHTSNAPEDVRFLGVGVPDAIIMRLSNVRQLRPRPTIAVLRYENQNINYQEVGQALACEYLLTGMVLLELIEPEVRAALDISPENRGEALVLRYLAAFHSGRFAEAVALIEEYNRSSQNRPDTARLFEAYYYYGMPERAEELIRQDRSGGPRQMLWRQAILASYLAKRGARAQAEAILREITANAEDFHHASYSIGAAYAQLGDKAKARLWLARAVETGFPCYPWYERDTLLKPLRDDPEFKQFMAELKKSWEAAKVKYAPKA